MSDKDRRYFDAQCKAIGTWNRQISNMENGPCIACPSRADQGKVLCFFEIPNVVHREGGVNRDGHLGSFWSDRSVIGAGRGPPQTIVHRDILKAGSYPCNLDKRSRPDAKHSADDADKSFMPVVLSWFWVKPQLTRRGNELEEA